MVLKIAVLSSGTVLADGQPVPLDRLEDTLQALTSAKGVVWYYREAAAEAEDQGMKIIQLVVKNKLPISISSKPDFSDYLDAAGVSHPRDGEAPADNFEPRMPEVAQGDEIETIFATARSTAAGEKGPRGLVVVMPDRHLLVMPALDETPALSAVAAGMERLVPSAVKRYIAVIGYTGFAGGGAAPNLTQANKAIPFFGLLTGLSYIGHFVWVFEGHESALAAGCRDADVLIVDSGMLPFLQKGWEATAAAVMRNGNIIVHDRSTFKLRFARKAGESRDRLEFPN